MESAKSWREQVEDGWRGDETAGPLRIRAGQAFDCGRRGDLLENGAGRGSWFTTRAPETQGAGSSTPLRSAQNDSKDGARDFGGTAGPGSSPVVSRRGSWAA